MTLPFRRRHHDDETAHDRARALASSEMLEPLGDDEATWLARHLDACVECRADREAYLADRLLLRSLRDRTPEPPRDLWARTSAALDREARTRKARGSGARGDRETGGAGRWRGLPFGAAAGALIVLVVVVASIWPSLVPPNQDPGRSQVAVVSPAAEPTPFEVTAGRVGWIQQSANGSWNLIIAKVDEVCPRSRTVCQALGEGNPGRLLNLGGAPTAVTISPTLDQLVVEDRGQGTAPDRIYVMPVPPAVPVETVVPTESATSGPTTTEPPATEPPATEPPATEPPATEPASPGPSPVGPDGAIEIASGVTVVGEAAYSADGKWLAFSARPSDGSTGPDLYLWTVGQPTALAVTTDHRTYFSAWLDGRVLASRVLELVAVSPSDAPSPAPTADAAESPEAGPADAHPMSFLLDPGTLTRVELAQWDMWLPVVDPTGRFVAYWSGTLVPTADRTDWQLGTGQLVLDGWSGGPDATATPDPAESVDPAATPVPPMGPTGTPVAVVTGQTAAFKAKFDPSGTRLAVWAGEQLDAAVGRLHLIVLDHATGAINPDLAPLPGAPALRRFSIDVGRLAWVSPPGQDGQESSVQVLGWSHDEFGEIRTIPARDLYIVR